MELMSVTLDVLRLSGWLNTDAKLNMESMSVTLDVSRLSGWLNDDASCRVERRAYDAERGVGREAGGRGPVAAHERYARGEGPAVKAGGAIGHARSAR